MSESCRRIKLTVAYDGTNYCGWQLQPNAVTIEEVLNKALSSALKEEIVVIGASRTDSGVHALGNVAVFDTNAKIPAEKISYAVNQKLPDDITVVASEEVPADFHPRYCDTLKTYEYTIYNDRHPNPIRRRFTHFFYVPLDVEQMQKAAEYLVGEHDFASFCSAKAQVQSTVRMIKEIRVTAKPIEHPASEQSGSVESGGNTESGGQEYGEFVAGRKLTPQEVTIRVTGDGFLYNMVRMIAGVLMRVGIGYYPPEEVKKILEKEERGYAKPTAPACGLTLIGIEYIEQKTDFAKSLEGECL